MCIVLWACACAHRHARATMDKHAAYVSIESLETHIVYFAQPQLAMYTQMYVYLDIYSCKYYVPGPPHHCLVPSHTTNNTGSSGSSITQSCLRLPQGHTAPWY